MSDSGLVLPRNLSEDVLGLVSPEDGGMVERASDPALQTLDGIERRALLEVAAAHRGTRRALAEKLGIS